MEQNPYQAPAAVVSDPATAVPQTVERDIRNGWIAGAISGTMTLVFTLAAMSGVAVLNFSAWELADVALIFGLAYGIYRRSRFCAVVMLLYFIYAKIALLENGASVSGMGMAVVFIYFYARAIVGTFRYRKIVAAKA